NGILVQEDILLPQRLGEPVRDPPDHVAGVAATIREKDAWIHMLVPTYQFGSAQRSSASAAVEALETWQQDPEYGPENHHRFDREVENIARGTVRCQW